MTQPNDPIQRDDDLQGDAPDNGIGDGVLGNGTGELTEAEPPDAELGDEPEAVEAIEEDIHVGGNEGEVPGQEEQARSLETDS